MVRHYSKQLIQAVHYMHSMGVAHRDIKCENILLDANFDIKVVDLGFACPLGGKNESGFQNDYVGSRNYMAPEILMKRPYQPAVVDLFALGVVMFMLYSGSAPFEQASYDDPHYRLLALNEQSTFWKAHEQGRPKGFFSEDFKNLISNMLAM